MYILYRGHDRDASGAGTSRHTSEDWAESGGHRALSLRHFSSQPKDQPETGIHVGKVVRRQPAGQLYEPSLIEAAYLRHDKD